MDNGLRKFKDRQYKFVKENINNHKLNSVTGWVDSAKKDVQSIRSRKLRY
jgi:hypothetical protein|tara:strand:- start:3843 stop:3992 length:150 start_codon:yes stop_codon:yes gene_type:complete